MHYLYMYENIIIIPIYEIVSVQEVMEIKEGYKHLGKNRKQANEQANEQRTSNWDKMRKQKKK